MLSVWRCAREIVSHTFSRSLKGALSIHINNGEIFENPLLKISTANRRCASARPRRCYLSADKTHRLINVRWWDCIICANRVLTIRNWKWKKVDWNARLCVCCACTEKMMYIFSIYLSISSNKYNTGHEFANSLSHELAKAGDLPPEYAYNHPSNLQHVHEDSWWTSLCVVVSTSLCIFVPPPIRFSFRDDDNVLASQHIHSLWWCE